MNERSAFVILPHQLFEKNIYLPDYETIYIVEDPYYLKPNFHKQKLCLHVASMNYYYELLKKKYPKKKIIYVAHNNCSYKIHHTYSEVGMFHPVDQKSVIHWKSKNTTFYDPPNFILTRKDGEEYIREHQLKNRFNHSHFYKWQRIRLGLFVDEKNQPLYGSWSFDKENRRKFEAGYKEPFICTYQNSFITNAKKYIHKHFEKAFGSLDDFYYPVTHAQAKSHMRTFIYNKLATFGIHQDSISKNVIFGDHSILSSSLNIGILLPQEVIKIVLQFYNDCNSTKKREIYPSVEGFVRQIIGWREYMRFIYIFRKKEIQKLDYLPLHSKLPNSWYSGKTDLEILNHYIEKVKKYAYLHHIERLMVMNNIAVLYEIRFKDIYNWFMRCFIDSYDWVMLPNVLMNYNSLSPTSKFMGRAYLASDNYIKKMSNFANKRDFEIIHELYHSFLRKHKNVLSKDYVLASQLKR